MTTVSLQESGNVVSLLASVEAVAPTTTSTGLSMPLMSRSVILCTALLAGCGNDSSTAPRTVASEPTVTATIVSIADVPLFVGEGPAVHAQVLVRNQTTGTVSIVPCTSFIEARLPSSRTWSNIGFYTVGLCPSAESPLAARASAELGASGSATEFRALAGADARAVVIRAGFMVRAGAESSIVYSGEYTVTRP